MAERVVYYVNKKNVIQKQEITFKWYSGFSFSQKQKSIKDLHGNFLKKHPNLRIIEISTASENELGVRLSAVNLTLKTTRGIFTIEQLFQAGKCFKNAGNNMQLLKLDGREARRITKQLTEEDELIGFELFGKKFPLQPTTLFYDWLYLCGIKQHPELQKALLNYDAFTDIYATPKYTLNTQAEACNLYVALCRNNLWDKAMKNTNSFSKLLYDKNDFGADKRNKQNKKIEQIKLFKG